MALSINQLLEHFELHESVVGLVADTTASNTGHLNGALVLLVLVLLRFFIYFVDTIYMNVIFTM